MSILDTINSDISSVSASLQQLAASTGQSFDPNPMHSTFIQGLFGQTPTTTPPYVGSPNGGSQPAGAVNMQKILLYGAGAYVLMKILK